MGAECSRHSGRTYDTRGAWWHISHGSIMTRAYLISRSLTSKMRVLLAGMPGRALLPYAMLAGTVRRLSPPIAIPRIPTSQPLMTSPLPTLKLKGLPFLLAARKRC